MTSEVPRKGCLVNAVIVTFNPDSSRLRAVLLAVTQQVEGVLLVDNGSANISQIEALVEEFRTTSLESLGSNYGIATALNIGVRLARRTTPDWVLTLDQDTVLQSGAVSRVLDEFFELPPDVRANCAIVAMSRPLPEPRGFRRRWIQRYIVVAEHGLFREMNTVITSGNLVRSTVFDSVLYDDDLFIDHVDTAFCVAVRKSGGQILEFREPTMEHRLGRTVETPRGERTYEGGIRIYYITRNGFTLVLGHELPIRVFLRDIIGFSRVYINVNGLRSFFRCFRMVSSGLRDAVLRRLGPRDDQLRRVPLPQRTVCERAIASKVRN